MARQRKAPKSHVERRGRKPSHHTIRVNWVGEDLDVLRFTISADLVEQLKRAHDAAFGILYGFGSLHEARAGYDPYKTIRIEFMRFEDTGIPAVFIRIEPPTYHPTGHRMWKVPNGHQFQVEVRCREVGVKPDMPNLKCDYLFDEKQPKVLGGGMIVSFPDHYINFSGVPVNHDIENARVQRRKTEEVT